MPNTAGDDGTPPSADHVVLFLSGDVMTGRGVDQILAHPSGPRLFEPYVDDARAYVEMAEARNGSIAKPAAPGYIWGHAMAELARMGPDIRIVNLETAVTTSDDYWRGKGINYRMHPENVVCLTAARIDVCGLANNHVIDFGYSGLTETLDTLRAVGVKTVGAGRTLADAQAPAVVTLANEARVVIFAWGTESSGVLPAWAAGEKQAGVDLLPDLSDATAAAVVDRVRQVKLPGDVVVGSIHWGPNWGYDVSPELVRFARRLVDGGVDLLHGHSSHHPRPIEVYRSRLILYGCGDFINDYEGIEGYEQYRDDLVLMYFATVSISTGALVALEMTPMQIKRMQLNPPSDADTKWLCSRLNDVSAPFKTRVELCPEGRLSLRWEGTTASQCTATEPITS